MKERLLNTRRSFMISHEELAAEINLRKCISRAIGIVERKLIKESVDALNKEISLRNIIQDMILEAATADSEKDPHEATGLNVLEDLLKKIIPIIETDFKMLTTDISQRESFRAHIIHAIQNTLAPVKVNDKADDLLQEGMRDLIISSLITLIASTGVASAAPQGPAGPANAPSIEEIMPKIEQQTDEDLLNAYLKVKTAPKQEKVSVLKDLVDKVPLSRLPVKGTGAGVKFHGTFEESSLNEDIGVDILDKDEQDKKIDINNDGKADVEEPPDPKEEFSIEGHDETGRNAAYITFKKIENQIVDAFVFMGNEEDQEIFYDYLITNVKLYFDEFEDELNKKLAEPTTDTYEQEKAAAAAEEPVEDIAV